MISNIEDYLLAHPLVESSADLQELISSAQAKLADAYQSVNVPGEDTQFENDYDYWMTTKGVTYSNDLPEYTEPTLS
jgi:anaerobic selenocysteine-containing dehydrogenase